MVGIEITLCCFGKLVRENLNRGKSICIYTIVIVYLLTKLREKENKGLQRTEVLIGTCAGTHRGYKYEKIKTLH